MVAQERDGDGYVIGTGEPVERPRLGNAPGPGRAARPRRARGGPDPLEARFERIDRKSTRLNSSHTVISYAVFCLKKKKIFGTVIAVQQAPRSEDHPPALLAH